jgi:hypothetical protein
MQKEQFGPRALMAALRRKDYVAIAQHAHLHNMPEGNIDELARVVGERTKPIGVAERSGISAGIDRALSRAMAVTLPQSFAV